MNKKTFHKKETEHSECCRVMKNLYPETWHKKESIQELGKYLRGMNLLFPKLKEVTHIKVANPNMYDEGFGDGYYCFLDDYIADFLKVCDRIFESESVDCS